MSSIDRILLATTVVVHAQQLEIWVLRFGMKGASTRGLPLHQTPPEKH